jgi:RHS repeat-associated protein
MFTGRQFDIETGLYYYRARYYNPYIGRFLQTDPVGYGYAYCGNNPLGRVDPSGLADYTYGFLDLAASAAGLLTFACFDSDKNIVWTTEFSDLASWQKWISSPRWFGSKKEQLPGYHLTGGNEQLFWDIQTLIYLGYKDDWESKIAAIEKAGRRALEQTSVISGSRYQCKAQDGIGTVLWRRSQSVMYGGMRGWHRYPNLAALAHELGHAYDDVTNGMVWPASLEESIRTEKVAMEHENQIRYAFYRKVPGYSWVLPRPAYGFSRLYPDVYPPLSSDLHPDIMWDEWLLNPELDP